MVIHYEARGKEIEKGIYCRIPRDREKEDIQMYKGEGNQDG